MSVTVTLPNKWVIKILSLLFGSYLTYHSYEYVGAALFSTVWLLLGQGIMVSRYRKRAGIKYPQSAFRPFRCYGGANPLAVYAEKAEAEASKDAQLFNCAQR